MRARHRLKLTRKWLRPVVLSSIVMVFVAAGAAAAAETDTVGSYGKGLWWSISLITTVGFVGDPPRTVTGAVLSVVLMVVGFLLLALVSASMAALFVREEEQPRDDQVAQAEDATLAALRDIQERLAKIEQRLDDRP